MLKLSVSFSKKVPGSTEYSSDGFLCALESEVSDSALNNPRELRERMLFLWTEAKKSVEEQIASGNGHKPAPPAATPTPSPAPAGEPTPQNGDGPATAKQTKYLVSLAQRDHGMKIADLKAYLLKTVGTDDPHKLTKAQASTAIEGLVGKAGGA
jgi:hypothetical protein